MTDGYQIAFALVGVAVALGVGFCLGCLYVWWRASEFVGRTLDEMRKTRGW